MPVESRFGDYITLLSCLFVAAGFMPAERGFDDYTATVDLQSTRVLKPAVHWHEASGAVTTSFGSCLVPKPSDHWHRASGADGLPLSSLLTVNPHSGFGHNALNFRGRTPRLRFDRMSSSATTTIHRSEASGEAAMPRWSLTPSHARTVRACC